MRIRWSSAVGMAIVAGLLTFAALSLVAGVERRGLTWWDPPLIAAIGLAAFALTRALRR